MYEFMPHNPSPTYEDWCIVHGHVPVPINTVHALTMLHSLHRSLEDIQHTASGNRITDPKAFYATVSLAVADLQQAQRLLHQLNAQHQALNLPQEHPHLLQTLAISQRFYVTGTLIADLQQMRDTPDISRQVSDDPALTWWYLHHIANITNGNEAQRLADDYANRTSYSEEWNEDTRQATVATLQQIATRPHIAMPQRHADNPPDPELARQAQDAVALTRKLHQSLLERYNESLPAEIHPVFAQIPSMEQDIARTIIPAAGARTDVITNDAATQVERDPEHPLSTHLADLITHANIPIASMIAAVSFIHDGRKHIKPLSEINPYPKGFDTSMARVHAKQAILALDEANLQRRCAEEGTPPPPPPLLAYYRLNARHALNLANAGLHTLSSGELADLNAVAVNAGLSAGARASLINAITNDDQNMADMLLADPQGNWRRTATTRQADQVLEAARDSGVDQNTLAKLAQAMGRPDHPSITTPQLISQEAAQLLEQAADAAGIDPMISRHHIGALTQQHQQNPADQPFPL